MNIVHMLNRLVIYCVSTRHPMSFRWTTSTAGRWLSRVSVGLTLTFLITFIVCATGSPHAQPPSLPPQRMQILQNGLTKILKGVQFAWILTRQRVADLSKGGVNSGMFALKPGVTLPTPHSTMTPHKTAAPLLTRAHRPFVGPRGEAQAPLLAASSYWDAELAADPDREYILNGVIKGFSIVDSPETPKGAYCKNYRSTSLNHEKVEASIQQEIGAGNYMVCSKKPHVVSALGAIPKPDSSDIRLIHDLSRGGVNQLAFETSVKYPTVEDALALMGPNAVIAKVDLRHAYRAVSVHPSCYELTGLQWVFAGESVPTYLRDMRLPFGAAKACHIFQRLTNSIVRMMAKRGFQCVGYLDDFIVIAKDFTVCKLAFNCLLELLQKLGFSINWGKTVPPCQKLVFLGIEIDALKRRLALPAAKLTEVKDLLAYWSSRKRARKNEIQSLLGKLNWCCRVIRGGRSFMRRLIDLTSKVDNPRWFVRLSPDAKQDISWWLVALHRFNGTARFPADVPLPSFAYATDATTSAAAGFFANDWFFVNWAADHPHVLGQHITYLELYAVLLSVKRWGSLFKGRHIIVRSDNMATVAAVNNCTSKSKALMPLVREMFWLAVEFDFKLTAIFIPGVQNVMADRLSRLNEPRCAYEALQLLTGGDVCYVHNHMSYDAFLYLQETWGANLLYC